MGFNLANNEAQNNIHGKMRAIDCNVTGTNSYRRNHVPLEGVGRESVDSLVKLRRQRVISDSPYVKGESANSLKRCFILKPFHGVFASFQVHLNSGMGYPNGIFEIRQDVKNHLKVGKCYARESFEAKQQLTGFISTAGDIVFSTELCV